MSQIPEIRFKGFVEPWEQRKYEKLQDCKNAFLSKMF